MTAPATPVASPIPTTPAAWTRRSIAAVAAIPIRRPNHGTSAAPPAEMSQAADAAGPAVVPAIALAALVAGCNGLSSAELAANHPVSGGTYEYGYRWLRPALGFTAGWMSTARQSCSSAKWVA